MEAVTHGDGVSTTLCLPRDSCHDVEGLCPVCGVWLTSPLVFEDVEWSDGPLSSKYRFVSWDHWDFSQRDLISHLDYLVTRWNYDHPLSKLIREHAARLGMNRALRLCPGSFLSVTTIRPIHGGGSYLRWGPRWRDELVRVLTSLTSEPEDRDRVAKARGLIRSIEDRWDDAVPIRVDEGRRHVVEALPHHETRESVMRDVERLLVVVKEILR